MFSLQQIQATFKAVVGWAKSIPSGPDGNGSSSRVIGLIVTVTVTGVLIGYFHVRHDLPSASQLYGLAAILGTGIGAYVAHKMGGKPDDPGGDAGTQ